MGPQKNPLTRCGCLFPPPITSLPPGSTCPLSLQLPLWAGLSKAGDGVIPKNGSEDSGSFFGVRVAQDSAALRFPVGSSSLWAPP